MAPCFFKKAFLIVSVWTIVRLDQRGACPQGVGLPGPASGEGQAAASARGRDPKDGTGDALAQDGHQDVVRQQ